MRVQVLVPSDEYRNYAGARIRYGRLQPSLADLGIGFELCDIEEFDPFRTECDVLIISKCHDARSLVAAAGLARRGCLVGVDLFDNYFSQQSDSRLTRFRTWLSQVSRLCHFALCSTPAMVQLVSDYRSDLPFHVTNDPAADFRLPAMPDILESKLVDAQDSRTLRLAWFGIGDNPYFSVGLTDLLAHGASLTEFRDAGFDVDLTVLTNKRALDADGLEQIRRMPVRTTVREWSESAEEELLASAFACVIPVNFQQFSIAKSLNRAVTALTSGCQVLSLGYPLYEALDTLLYRQPADLIGDLQRGSMRLSSRTLDTYRDLLAKFASPHNEASKLARFLRELRAPVALEQGPIAVVHGYSTSSTAHKLVKEIGGLSVGSPYCTARMAFDIIFKEVQPQVLAMFVSAGVADRLSADLRQQLRPAEAIDKNRYWLLPDASDSAASLGQRTEAQQPPLTHQIASYAPTMDQIRRRLEDTLDPSQIILSETAPLPLGWR